MKLVFDDKRRDLENATSNEKNVKKGKNDKEKIELAEKELAKAKESFENYEP